MDHILIRDLLVRCIVGVREEERREKQDVLINLWLSVDLRAAGASDRLEDTVDYSSLKKRILSHVEGSKYLLLEALAQSVAKICLDELAVRRAKVRVEKPTALRFARSVGVEIVRRKEA
jgi:dihydroneopterin aldolase/D-erythro-7,8-dihydroneopterin triphosphate epimerase